MYEHVFHHFGLRNNPFGISPDPRQYVSMPTHDAALGQLILGTNRAQNFTVLIGDAGTGKTILLNRFLDWLQRQGRSSAYVFHPQLKPVELFKCILRDFGVPHAALDKGQLLESLSRWLISRHGKGDRPIVVIDEAQAISIRTLDQLRWLLNLEASGQKLLQIVLVGQPELEEKLRRPELRQLRKRVTSQFSLEPFSVEETSRYVNARLTSAGAANSNIFSQASLDDMHGYARGIPRTVNLLGEQALVAAYAAGAEVISPEILRQVAGDFDLTPHWADSREREISPKFAQLLTHAPEISRFTVAPTNSNANSNAEIPVSKPQPEISVPEFEQSAVLEPTFVEEERGPQFATTPVAASEPIAGTALDSPSTLEEEREPQFATMAVAASESIAETALDSPSTLEEEREPQFATTPVAASESIAGTALDSPSILENRNPPHERSLVAQKETPRGQWVAQTEAVRADFVRNRAKFRNRYAQAAIKSNWAALVTNIAKSTQKLDDQRSRQWQNIRAGLARVWTELNRCYLSVLRAKEPVLTAIKSNWAGLVRNIAKSTQKLNEQRSRQWKGITTGLAQISTELRSRNTPAKVSKDIKPAAFKTYSSAPRRDIAKDPVLTAVRGNWSALLREISKLTEWLTQASPRMNWRVGGTTRRFAAYCREVRDSFIRDLKQLIPKKALPKPEALVPPAASDPPFRPTIVKSPVTVIHRERPYSPVVSDGTRRNAQFARQWRARRERSLGKSTQFMQEPSAIPQPQQEQPHSTKFGRIGRTRLRGGRFARYWKDVRASFLRDWNQLMSTDGSVGMAARKRR